MKVIGVQMADSDAMLRSVRAGKRVTLPDVGLFADGTAVKQVGVETFRLARALVSRISNWKNALVTPEAARHLAKRCFDAPVWIEAGAGTGKTTVARLMADGKGTAEAAMVKIALASGTNALIRDALISGLMGREDEMIARLTFLTSAGNIPLAWSITLFVVAGRGRTMAELPEDEKNRLLTGIVALQIHAGAPMKIEFKTIRVKELK